MSTYYTESNYENAILQLFQSMGYSYTYGPDVERDHHSRFVLGTMESAQPESAHN